LPKLAAQLEAANHAASARLIVFLASFMATAWTR